MKTKIKRAYIYPFSARDRKLGIFNPYVNDEIKAFSPFFTFINTIKPSKSGIFDIAKYLFKTNVVFFHWVEKLPEMEVGKLQSFFLLVFLPIRKVFGIKIIWTMHNKISHSKEHYYLKKLLFKRLLKNSDLILTHSSEGIRYGAEIHPGSKNKIHYLPHPIKDRRIGGMGDKKYDILIWGMISPYKGIHNFLEYLQNSGLQSRYRIMIIGKSAMPEYVEQLKKHASEYIRIENKFLEERELQKLITQSRVVLFTYSKASILSSGVLMDSLGFGASIIGPKVGAFKDLEELGIVNTFKDFNEIPSILERQVNTKNSESNPALDQFLRENSWNKFAEKVVHILSEK